MYSEYVPDLVQNLTNSSPVDNLPKCPNAVKIHPQRFWVILPTDCLTCTQTRLKTVPRQPAAEVVPVQIELQAGLCMSMTIPRFLASSLLFAECCSSLRRKAQMYLNTLRWLVGIAANTCTQTYYIQSLRRYRICTTATYHWVIFITVFTSERRNFTSTMRERKTRYNAEQFKSFQYHPFYCTQWTAKGFVFGAIIFFLFWYEIFRKPMKGFAPNSHGRRVWYTSLGRDWRSRSKVKVTRDKKRHFSALSAALRFIFGKTSLASSYVLLCHM